jgi:hypothetical protein
MGTVQDGWCVEQLPPGANVYVDRVWSSGPKDVWVAGYEIGYESQIQAFVAHNDGCGWTRQASPLGDVVWAMWGSGPSDVWVAGNQGKAAHFDGQTFTPFVIDAEGAQIRAISGVAPNDVWAVSGSGFFHWDGAAWSRVSTGEWTSGAADVWATAANDVWTVSGLTGIHYDGTSFTTAPIPAPHAGMGTVFANETGVFAGGQGEQIVRFQNGAWVELAAYQGSSQGFTESAGMGTDIFLVGNSSLWRWDGTTFRRWDEVPITFVASVWVSQPQTWITGSEGRIAHRPR